MKLDPAPSRKTQSLAPSPSVPQPAPLPRAFFGVTRSFLLRPLLLAVGLGGCQGGTGGGQPAGPSASTSAATSAPVQVATTVARAQKIPQLVPVVGTLVGDRRTQLSANATGRVVAVRVERGQMVEQNQILLTLDVRSATNAAKEARANLQNLQVQRTHAQADCKRFEALHQKQAITQQEYENTMAQCHEADAQLEAAQARVEEALRTLGDGEVRAPYAGLISERTVDVGDYVRQDSPVATLLVPDPLRLQCGIPEAHAQAAKVGSTMLFGVAAYPDREFSGTIRFVSGEVRTSTRDILVEATVPNPSHELLAGMFATAYLVAGERELPVVPKSALRPVGDGHVAFVVEKGVVNQHAVRAGRALGEEVAIEAGVAVGDKIVVQPSAELVDGAAVKLD